MAYRALLAVILSIHVLIAIVAELFHVGPWLRPLSSVFVILTIAWIAYQAGRESMEVKS